MGSHVGDQVGGVGQLVDGVLQLEAPKTPTLAWSLKPVISPALSFSMRILTKTVELGMSGGIEKVHQIVPET